MDLHLNGKIAVITGGASGIGKAVVAAFAQEGCKIATCDVNEKNLEILKDEFNNKGYEIYTEVLDVSSFDSVHTFANNVASHYGKIDIWVNNAGIFNSSYIIETDFTLWNRVMSVNLDSVFSGIQAAAQHMKDTGGGVIINTSSYTSKVPAAKRCAYAASKHGINGLTQISAGELAPYGIRVNAIAPGTIETPMQLQLGRTPEEKAKLVEKIALQRGCAPEELANAYLFLASDVSSYITGIVLEVSGGKITLQDNYMPWKDSGINVPG